MPECDFCDNLEFPAFSCRLCGKIFCSEHILPQRHDCLYLRKKTWIFEKNFGYKANSILLAIILLLSIAAFFYRKMFDLFALDPSLFLKEPWRLITSMFLHAGPLHLFFNSFVLYMFGYELEKRLGRIEFFKIFFLSGIFAALSYSLISILLGCEHCVAVGASGAIYGIFGVLAMIAPEIRVIIIFPPIPYPVKIQIALLIFIVIDFLLRASGVQIANSAHLAGLLFGLMYGKIIRSRARLIRRLYI
jgi:membrane associated rhomboid family serine protease